MILLGGKKSVLILVSLALLLGAGGGYLYHRFSGEADQDEESEPERYFEGPLFYEGVGEERWVVVIEGLIAEIDDSGLTIARGSEMQGIPRDLINKVIASNDADGPADQKDSPFIELAYSDLVEGMLVSFTPSSGYLLVSEFGSGAQ